MVVKAKLFVSSVKRQVSSPDSVEITLAAVTQGDENKEWAEATPAASFSMTIQNPPAAAYMGILGQEYYVTFEKAETKQATLADGHEYVPSEYEKQKGGKVESYFRCEVCKTKRAAHDEPLRSQVIKMMGI